MTAFDEYDKERREIDELILKGYWIQNIQENLDGALVTFVQSEARLELPLLTADARKYVVTRYMEMKRSQAG